MNRSMQKEGRFFKILGLDLLIKERERLLDFKANPKPGVDQKGR